MRSRRMKPVAGWSTIVLCALLAATLLATVLTTRASILDASDSVRHGEALAIEQGIRADLSDFESSTTSADLEAIIRSHGPEGLRYLAVLDDRARVIVEAGTSSGSSASEPLEPARHAREFAGRLRFELRAGRRTQPLRLVAEVEPLQANELRRAAARVVAIGCLATFALLAVAFILVRREARRRAHEQARARERQLASLGEMSAVLAHEIKNPLASLKGNAQLLAGLLGTGEKSRAKADRVVAEAIRLEQLIADLLHFVRSGAIDRAEVDPAILVRDAAASVRGEIVIEDAGAPPRWSLDANRFREVLVNLLDNAVAAGPPVTISVATQRDRLVVEVADRGPGVPAENRQKIFEPFVTGKTKGTGLGLAIAKRVVELHEGAITVDDNPGGGARFRIEIPS